MLRPIVLGILTGAALFFLPFLFFILFFFFIWRFFFRPRRRAHWHYHEWYERTVPIDGRHAYQSYDSNTPHQTITVH